MRKIFTLLVATFLIPTLTLASVRTSKRTKRDKVPIVTLKISSDRTVVLRDDINESSVSPVVKSLTDLDANNNLPIYLIIRSSGGSVSDGVSLITAIESVNSEVICIIDTEAFSMAAIIGVHCNLLYMHKSSSIMLHEAYFGLEGQESQMKSRMKFIISSLEDVHVGVAKVLNMPLVEYKNKIKDEWWMNADEAALAGVADGVLEELLYNWTPPAPEPNQGFLFLPPKRLPRKSDVKME